MSIREWKEITLKRGTTRDLKLFAQERQIYAVQLLKQQ